jgi:hypothetical protein
MFNIFESYTSNGMTINNDAVMCQFIKCYNPQPDKRVPNGYCSTSGTGINGKKKRQLYGDYCFNYN